MKLDKDYIKYLLNKAHESERSVFRITDLVDKEEMLSEKFIMHMQILADKALIVNDNYDSNEIGISRLGNGAANWGIVWLRLTSDGHDFVEALNNETVWKKIKKELKSPSISTLMSTANFLLQQAIKNQFD